LREHPHEVQRQTIGSWRGTRGENDFPVDADAFELGAPFAAATDFKGDAEPIVIEDKIRCFAAPGGFQVVDCDACQARGKGEEVLPQAASSLVGRAVQQAQRRHEEDFGLAQNMGSKGKTASQDKGALESSGVLFRLVFGDPKIAGQRGIADAVVATR
jgi:hypothetical protein